MQVLLLFLQVTVVENPINTVQLQYFVLCNLVHVPKAPFLEDMLTSVLDGAATT